MEKTESHRHEFEPGSIVRSNNGRGAFLARVVAVDAEFVHFELLEVPKDFKDPLKAWKMKWALVGAAYWKRVGTMVKREALGVFRASIKKGPTMAVAPVMCEWIAEQVKKDHALPAGCVPLDLQEIILVDKESLLKDVLGVYRDREVNFFLRDGDWVVYRPDVDRKFVIRAHEFNSFFQPIDAVGRDTEFIRSFNLMQQSAHNNSVKKGFWPASGRNDGEMLALIMSELGETLEGLREGNPASEKIPGFSSAEEELADAIIRIMDMCGGRKWDVARAIAAKFAYNAGRPFLHGKTF